MREITKTISIHVDGSPKDFRLTKLDAFSGASLLRMISNLPTKVDRAVQKGCHPDASCSEQKGCHSDRSGGIPNYSPADLITCLSDTELRSLMTVCLEHVEVSLPAGWNPVMTRGEWTWPELRYDTAVCLKLTIEEVLWTLEGFFGEGGSTSRQEIPAS